MKYIYIFFNSDILLAIPLTTSEEMFYNIDDYTLKKRLIILILVVIDPFFRGGTLLTLTIPSTNQIKTGVR